MHIVPSSFLGATLATILCFSLCACGAKPREKASSAESSSEIQQINQANSGDAMTQTFSADQRKDLADGTAPKRPNMDTSGITFAPGELPVNLTGKTFYATGSFGGDVTFTSDSQGVFHPYKASEIPITYSVRNMDEPRLTLSYKDGDSQREVTYQVTRGEQYAMLHIAEPTDPWPIMLKGIAE